jgi:hypothetical protein
MPLMVRRGEKRASAVLNAAVALAVVTRTVVTRIGPLLTRPEAEHALAVQGVAPDGVVRVVDQEQRVAGGHMHAVGAIRKLARTPGVEEVARANRRS